MVAGHLLNKHKAYVCSVEYFTTPDTVAKTTAKHTANVNVKASSAKAQIGLDAFFNSKELYQAWMTKFIDLSVESY